MPLITPTNMNQAGAITPTVITLNGTDDSFAYNATRNPVLILDNVSGGALTPIIDGAGGTTVPVTGAPDGLDVSAGFAVGSIPAGEKRAIALNSIKAFLTGAISITGGTAIEAVLQEF